jgi:hypothetical protein
MGQHGDDLVQVDRLHRETKSPPSSRGGPSVLMSGRGSMAFAPRLSSNLSPSPAKSSVERMAPIGPQVAEIAIGRGDESAAVPDRHKLSISPEFAGKDDQPRLRRPHRGAFAGRDSDRLLILRPTFDEDSAVDGPIKLRRRQRLRGVQRTCGALCDSRLGASDGPLAGEGRQGDQSKGYDASAVHAERGSTLLLQQGGS